MQAVHLVIRGVVGATTQSETIARSVMMVQRGRTGCSTARATARTLRTGLVPVAHERAPGWLIVHAIDRLDLVLLLNRDQSHDRI